MMNLIDTHCHIHDVADFDLSTAEILRNAREAGVGQIITVGTDVENSRAAVEFAAQHDGVFALIGVHPGVGSEQNVAELEGIVRASGLSKTASRRVFTVGVPENIRKSAERKTRAADVFGSPETFTSPVCGLGDIGLDYHYQPYDRARQIKLLEQQLDLAVKYDLPISFHVREAFDDFWAIFDSFPRLRGTLHSYTDNVDNVKKGLSRGLYISLNGILTFNREEELNKVFVQVPPDRVIFETDAPYLAPKPYRGKINQPAYIRDIAEFFAQKRGIALEETAKNSTKNAKKLFSL
jgi:TatD DNase family protein